MGEAADRLYSQDIPNTPEDMWCESRLYGVAIDKVCFPSEEIFEEDLEIHVDPKLLTP